MADVTLLTEPTLRQLVPLDLRAVDAVEAAFAALGSGEVIMPPVLSMALPQVHGEVDVKTAFVPGFDRFAVKISPGFFGNPALGLPSLNGLMVALSARTGIVDAVLLDNGYLTDVRTAAAGAVAARYLAPENASTVTVLGTGVQAELQVLALTLVLPLRRCIVWGRDREKAAALAKTLCDKGLEAFPEADPAKAVGMADVIVTTTPSRAPILLADWLLPGQHITAMGSDAPDKNELQAAVLSRADLYVADRTSQCETIGELRAARAAGVAVDVVELGDIVCGRAPGRSRPQQLTVCDLTGTGAQDTAIADLALRAAAKAHAGTRIAT